MLKQRFGAAICVLLMSACATTERVAERSLSRNLEVVNVKRAPIPEDLQAGHNPYYASETMDCAFIEGELAEINAFLGDDFDENQTKPMRPIEAATDMVSTAWVPYKSVIKYVTGAKQHEKAMQQARDRALTRRGFLKAKGEMQNCDTAARPKHFELRNTVEEKPYPSDWMLQP